MKGVKEFADERDKTSESSTSESEVAASVDFESAKLLCEGLSRPIDLIELLLDAKSSV